MTQKFSLETYHGYSRLTTAPRKRVYPAPEGVTPLTTLEQEKQYRPVNFKTLTQDEKRYLADLLINHLRDGVWALRVNPVYSPVQPTSETPSWKTIGAGRSDPIESTQVMSFTAPPVYEMEIPKFLVALEEEAYNDFSQFSDTSALEGLLRGVRGDVRVFVAELSGYGTAKKLKYRRAKSVTREQAHTALDLLECCVLAKYGNLA